MTVSHLRFGPRPDPLDLPDPRAPRFVACHQFSFLERIDVLDAGRRRCHLSAQQPRSVPTRCGITCRATLQETIIAKHLRLFVIDADRVAQRGRHGRPHQHRDADLLLRAQRRAAARRGDRRHQARDREDLRQARRGGRAEELRRGRRGPGAPARGRGPGDGRPAASTRRPAVPPERPRVRAAR